MPMSCSAYPSDSDAYAAVDRLLDEGTAGERITVLTGRLGAARDAIATFRDGVRRAHVASHRELERVLATAGLDAGAVAELHHGRVLVLVDGA
jgi:hypothetical protein